jgi:hypothetical protein
MCLCIIENYLAYLVLVVVLSVRVYGSGTAVGVYVEKYMANTHSI